MADQHDHTVEARASRDPIWADLDTSDLVIVPADDGSWLLLATTLGAQRIVATVPYEVYARWLLDRLTTARPEDTDDLRPPRPSTHSDAAYPTGVQCRCPKLPGERCSHG